ncbi:RNA 2'-phosphotransferase [Fodinibius sp. Rm-B-1B1-1]|uniref:RNA 2'-phosphotransferase n=1 Tax=Fodinibius alkaliphilus TaxID=3140241 RepID=UPI003159D216
MDLTSKSKFLSYILRHHPESIGLEVDQNGWADISDLITKAQKNGKKIDQDVIQEVIEKGAKQRFILSNDGNYIRAGYGHSIDVDLQLKPKRPPQKLYHGTAQYNVDAILDEGISSQSRNFVHLSATKEEAKNVGGRHGHPVILGIQALKMYEDGIEFYQSESEKSIWLTNFVSSKYIIEGD